MRRPLFLRDITPLLVVTMVSACGTGPEPSGSGAAGGGGTGGGGAGGGGAGGGEDLTVWPNSESRAISDPWIAEHHDQLREMHPRVLALNFVNGRTNADMEALLGQILAAMKEGSRYRA